MQPSDNCLKIIQHYEGLGGLNKVTGLYEPYLDMARIYTVGYGHALTTADGTIIQIGEKFSATAAKEAAEQSMERLFGKQAITQAEAATLCNEDMGKFASGISAHVADDTTQPQFDALVSFAYNVGMGNFVASRTLKFHNEGHRDVGSITLHTLWADTKAKIVSTDIALAFARWSYSAGVLALGLFRRRVSELLTYSGWDADKAIATAGGFSG